jgi:hypothetical protein
MDIRTVKRMSSGSGKHDGPLKVVSMKKEFQTIFMHHG